MLGDYSDVVDAPATPATTTCTRPAARRSPTRAEAINADRDHRAAARSRAPRPASYITKEWDQEFVAVAVPDRHHRHRRVPRRGHRAHRQVRSAPSSSSSAAARSTSMVDSHPYVHGKRVAIVGDPDVLLGLISFLLEIGMHAGPRRVHQRRQEVQEGRRGAARRLALRRRRHRLDQEGHVAPALAHVHRAGRPAARPEQRQVPVADTGTTFVRVGFPLFDRHHLHKRTILGYERRRRTCSPTS